VRDEYFDTKRRINNFNEGELEQFFKKVPSIETINQLKHLFYIPPLEKELKWLVTQYPSESEFFELFKKASPMAELEQLVKKSPIRGYFEEIMIKTFETEITRRKARKKEKTPWYVWLLRCQKEGGAFFGNEILEYYFEDQFRFVSTSKILDIELSSDVWLNIRSTWLAVTLLSADCEVAAIAEKQIQKAKKWLSQNNAQHLTINDTPIKEAFEKEFNMTLA
jgi:hypothetical protein